MFLSLELRWRQLKSSAGSGSSRMAVTWTSSQDRRCRSHRLGSRYVVFVSYSNFSALLNDMARPA